VKESKERWRCRGRVVGGSEWSRPIFKHVRSLHSAQQIVFE
jgi:hypothetical protein